MIEAKNLTKSFGSAVALDGISCAIGDGSIYGLVGSNGAGKSTFLRTVAGVYRPDGGEILVAGQPPFENTQVKSRMFFLPDFLAFPPQARLLDMAAFYSGVYPGWKAERFKELYGLFHLDPKARLSSFSKGMQRQAALVCALAAEPDLLLLDEVFDGLDPVMRQLLKKLVGGEVAGRGITVVIASHNLRELEDLCDHVGLFHKGGVVFERELDEWKQDISRVQAVFHPIPERDALPDLDIVRYDVQGSLLRLVVRGEREEILQRLNALQPEFMELLPLTLEEIFISEMEAAGYDIANILP